MKREKFTCQFCGHIWLSKITPKVCSECHNDWRNKRKKENENTNKKANK